MMMKSMLVAALAALTFSTSTLAADLAPMPVEPIAPAYTFSWTGFYVGGHIGYGWGDNGWATGNPVNNALGFSYDVDGFIGGLTVGGNYQMDQFVLGLEAEASWSGMDGSAGCFVMSAVCSSDINWMGTVGPRFGIAFDNLLLYAEGGFAWANADYRDRVNGAVLAASETHSGWFIGLGLEYAFNQNWSAKIEYNYADFGSESLKFDNFFPVTRVDLDAQTVKLGLNYRF